MQIETVDRMQRVAKEMVCQKIRYGGLGKPEDLVTSRSKHGILQDNRVHSSTNNVWTMYKLQDCRIPVQEK